jgi:protein gp37
MSDNSSIEWTDATWNPVRGCDKVSPGCAHCYAETFAERFRGVPGHPFEQGFDLRLVPEKLGAPQHWKSPKRVFVNSMSDLFHERVPEDYIAEVWKVMSVVRRHTYQVLTKRAQRLYDLMPKLVHTFGVLPNVWVGVSVENQHFADERIPLLLQTPAAVRFLSCEPLLGPVELTYDRFCGRMGWGPPELPSRDPDRLRRQTSWVLAPAPAGGQWPRINWVIAGGESGPGARPLHVSWVRSLVGQCRSAGVPVFVKQLGAHVEDRNDAGFEGDPGDSWTPETRHCALTIQGWQGDPVRILLRSRKGGDPDEWPADLRVRQFPEAAVPR